MRRIALFSALFISIVSAPLPAAAQDEQQSAMMLGRSKTGVLRVQVQYSVTAPAETGGSLADQQAAGAASRKALYEIAANECDTLATVFKSTCRLSNLNVQAARGPRNSPEGDTSSTASATYELTQKP